MGPLKDISGLSSNIKKLEKNNEPKKPNPREVASKGESVPGDRLSGDRAEISPEGREILNLRMDISKYLELIREAKLISQEQVAEIQERAISGFYSNPEVIDKIVDELLKLPNFISASDNPDADEK